MRKLILAAASIAALALVGPAAAQSPIVIKFSHVVAPNTPKGLAAEKFKELAEKYTAGKVKVEVYPNSQLYKDKEELEALQLGAVQMLAPSNAKFGPIGVKEMEVFDLPYILPDLKTLRKVTDGPLGKQACWVCSMPRASPGSPIGTTASRMMSANKKLLTPADFRGLKIRIQSSKVLEAQMRALGAIPQVMAFSEVYQALQTGVVDGQENTWSNIYTQKMHEVQKYITVTNHGYIGYVVVEQEVLGRPAGGHPPQLEKAMKEATAYGNGQSQKENDDALEEIKKTGKSEIIALTPEQKAAMRKAMMPVYTEVDDPRRPGNDRRVPEGDRRRDPLGPDIRAKGRALALAWRPCHNSLQKSGVLCFSASSTGSRKLSSPR